MSCQTFTINKKATRWGGLDFIGQLARVHSAPDHDHLSWKLAEQAIQ